MWRLPRPEGLANLPRVLKYLQLWRTRDILPEAAFTPLEAFLHLWAEDAGSLVPLSADTVVKRMEDDRDLWKRGRELTWVVPVSPMMSPVSPAAISHPTPEASPAYREVGRPGPQDPVPLQFRAAWQALGSVMHAAGADAAAAVAAAASATAAVEATPSESPRMERADHEQRELVHEEQELAYEEFAAIATLEDCQRLEHVLALGEAEARRSGDTRIPLRPALF